MKKIILLFLFIYPLFCDAQKTIENFIEIKDSSLLSVIKKSLNLGELDSITKKNALTLKEIKSYENVNDLSGIENFTNLEQLELSNYRGKISTIKPLKNLLQLQTLKLTVNSELDLSPLKKLKKLEYLNLKYVKSTNYSYLSNLENLKELTLHCKGFQNTEPLKKLSRLKYFSFYQKDTTPVLLVLPDSILTLSINFIRTSNLKGLSNLKHLENLSIQNCHFLDFTSFPNFPKLHDLIIRKSNFNKVSTLTHLESLSMLSLSDCTIKDYSNLQRIDKLNELYILNGNLQSISQLVNLNLIYLNISNADISDIQNLKSIPTLESIHLEKVIVKSLNFANTLQQLKRLQLNGTSLSKSQIEDFKTLHPNIWVYYME